MSKPPLATVVERFLTERRYLKNVTEVTDDLRELVLVGASGWSSAAARLGTE